MSDENGDRPVGEDDLLSLWPELRAIAQRLLSKEGRAHSVEPTALVLTALRRQKSGGWEEPFDGKLTWENRGHCFGQMHRAMRQFLIERGRKRQRREKQGFIRIDSFDLDVLRSRAVESSDFGEALGMALEALRLEHAEWCDLVEHRFFAGLTQAEAAEMLGISNKTAQLWFNGARLFLIEAINRLLKDSE